MATVSYTHRMDSDLQKQSEAVYAALGMPLETAIAVGGSPFDVRLDVPTKETVAAMLEAEEIAKDPSVEALRVEDALEELKK